MFNQLLYLEMLPLNLAIKKKIVEGDPKPYMLKEIYWGFRLLHT